MAVTLHPAQPEDIPRLRDLIERSARALCIKDYTANEVEAALKGAWGVDTTLIQDQTYLMAMLGNQIVGCGGWSFRTTLFGGDAHSDRSDAELDPETDPAKIRAFFVDPDFIGHQVGETLLQGCEDRAHAYGFRKYELMATLTGARFYARHGYVGEKRVKVDLPGNMQIDFIPMEKTAAN